MQLKKNAKTLHLDKNYKFSNYQYLLTIYILHISIIVERMCTLNEQYQCTLIKNKSEKNNIVKVGSCSRISTFLQLNFLSCQLINGKSPV